VLEHRGVITEVLQNGIWGCNKWTDG
jgi:hypothetical protein